MIDWLTDRIESNPEEDDMNNAEEFFRQPNERHLLLSVAPSELDAWTEHFFEAAADSSGSGQQSSSKSGPFFDL